MNTKTKLALAVLVASATWPGLMAQTTATSTATSKASTPVPTDDEVIQLSPFEVTTVKDTGYQATQTLAGTRIRTDLKDVGAAISVVTKEFLQDIGATDNGTLLQYTPNAEVAGTRGTYAGLGNATSVDESGSLRAPGSGQRVRGLAAADNARDFFTTDIPWDSYNADRIEILRGPNSILFGLGSPAGIVNASLRAAEFRNKGDLSMRAGSYGSVRTSMDVNQQLIPGVLAARFDGLWSDQKYQQNPAFENTKRYYTALRFDPSLFKNKSLHTSFKVKLENGDVKANRPRIVPPNDSITPWWRSTAITADNPFGGLGQAVVNNPYDPWRTDSVVAGDGRGLTQSSTVNFLPWLTDIANQQQPVYFVNGSDNTLYQAYGGYINNGARNSSGGFTGVSNGLVGKNTNGMFYGIQSLPAAVTAANAANSALFTDAKYGQYRTQSLTDSSVFDFYNNLIDGPNKREWEHWNSQNFDFSQTAFDERLGLNLTYDSQKYKRGGEALLGGTPTITMDILKNFADYYTTGSDGVSTTTNSNFGRAYVQGANTAGGSSYSTERDYKRASLFAELRPSDLFSNSFLLKLLGKQRFNGVIADEKFFNESRTWQLYANSQAWAGYWNGNDGSTSSFADRAPIAVVYLGNSLANRSTASGSNIPGIGSTIYLPDTGVYVFDTTWTGGTNYGSSWTVPSSLSRVYGSTATTQASNPENYVGWNSNFTNDLLRGDNGENESLLKSAQKALRETMSYSSSYQGYFWGDALVATLGWRYDQVKTKDVTASQVTTKRGSLNMAADTYRLPDEFPTAQIKKGHSTSGGAVLHLNRILKHDPLPLNVSLSYNESSNFQVTSVRRDVYGNAIANPTGKTYEYGILISTKDNKYSFRAVDYTTRTKNGTSTLSDTYNIGATVSNGLNWRNIFLYQLGGYDWASRNQDSYRNRWTNAYPSLTASVAAAELDSCIDGWNSIQKYLEGKGFFKAWNFTPTTSSVLVNRTTYLANPSAYTPDTSTVYNYSPSAPQGFSVTADTESKGYEFELTANPISNLRVFFNASRTVSTQSNVGGESLSDFVSYMNSMLVNSDGTATAAGKLPRWGGASNAIYTSIWAPWLSKYTLMKLQEGSQVPEIRKWRYNVGANYTFNKGLLKNVGVGASYRWQDKVIIGYPVLTGGSIASYDLTKPYYGPAEDAIDLWLSYEHKLTTKINWKIQLNIRNLGDKNGLIPISVEPDGKTWASVRIKPVQEWFVTNTFSF